MWGGMHENYVVLSEATHVAKPFEGNANSVYITGFKKDVGDRDIFDKLVEAAFEHAVLRALLAKAATAVWNEALNVESEGAEHAPVDVLVLADAHFFVLLLSILFKFIAYHCALQNILALSVGAS